MQESTFIFTGYQEPYSNACIEIHLEFFFFTMKVGQNSIFSLMVGVINFFSITLQKKGTDTVHKTFMNTLIYTVLKKKQHL